MSYRTLALALSLLAAACTHEQVRPASYDAALEQARAEHKVVLIDFFTTWCGPCKKLDATTWKDAKVLDWMSDKCVMIKIDAEKETALAKKFEVGAYPTILFVKPDGTVIDRLVGYRDAAAFLSEAEDALAGRNAITRAREKLEGHEKDPMARQDYASELARAGRNAEALEEYLWCFDHGAESTAYTGVRLSFLLGDIGRLGRTYPPAREALAQRRDAAEASLDRGEKPAMRAMEISAINRALGEPRRTLDLYDRLEAKGGSSAELRMAVCNELLPLLVEDRRYQHAVDLFDNPAGYVSWHLRLAQHPPGGNEGPEESDAMLAAMRKSHAVKKCAPMYEALAGAGRGDDAARIADQLVELHPVGETYATLIRCAARAGADDAARALGERGMREVPKEDKQLVRSALDQVAKSK